MNSLSVVFLNAINFFVDLILLNFEGRPRGPPLSVEAVSGYPLWTAQCALFMFHRECGMMIGLHHVSVLYIFSMAIVGAVFSIWCD